MSFEGVCVEGDPGGSGSAVEKIWMETDCHAGTPLTPTVSGTGVVTIERVAVTNGWLTVTSSSGDVALLKLESCPQTCPAPLLPPEDAARLRRVDTPSVLFQSSESGVEEVLLDTTECEPYMRDLLLELESRIPQRELGEMVTLYTSVVPSSHLASAPSPRTLFQAMAADRTLTSKNVMLLQALLWRCELHDLYLRVGDVAQQQEEKERTRFLYLRAPDTTPRQGCSYVHFGVRTIGLGLHMEAQIEDFRQRLVQLLGVGGQCVRVQGVVPCRSIWLTCLLPHSAHLALESAVTSREEVAGWLTCLGVVHISFQQTAPPFPISTSSKGPSRMSSIEEAEIGKSTTLTPPPEQTETKEEPAEEHGSTSESEEEEEQEVNEVLAARHRLQQLAASGDWTGLDLALRELPDRILSCLGTLLLPSTMETTVLHVAVREGYSLLLRLALQQPGISVDARDRKGSTPLLLAVKSGNSSLVTFLQCCTELQLIPDMKVANFNKRTPLHEAARHDDSLILKTLLEFAEASNTVLDVSAEDKRRCTPLLFAAKSRDVLKTFLDYADKHKLEVNLNAASDSGQTALHVAARQGVASVKTLLQYAAYKGQEVNLTAKAAYGVTPLHLACQRRTKMLKAMLAYARKQEIFVDVCVPDADGDTPMHIAVMEGNTEAVQLLKHFYLTQTKPADMQEALIAEVQNLVSDWVVKPTSYALSFLRFPWRSEPAVPDPEGVKKAPESQAAGTPEGAKEGGEAAKPLPADFMKKNRWRLTPMDIAAELAKWADEPPEDRRLPHCIEKKVWLTASRGDFL